ncbi:MAG: DUF4252 domain-containing protein [Prolixibacteraceae bacterium]
MNPLTITGVRIRHFFMLALMLIPFAVTAQKSPVDKLFEKYANRDGLTTVNISGALLGFASKIQEDSPESDFLSALKGVRILSVEDDQLNKSLDFYKELENDGFFKNHDYEVLMEVTEKDEVVRFYGKNAGQGKFSELLLVVGGDENALISIRGLIDPENIAKITGALNIDLPSVTVKK